MKRPGCVCVVGDHLSPLIAAVRAPTLDVQGPLTFTGAKISFDNPFIEDRHYAVVIVKETSLEVERTRVVAVVVTAGIMGDSQDFPNTIGARISDIEDNEPIEIRAVVTLVRYVIAGSVGHR